MVSESSNFLVERKMEHNYRISVKIGDASFEIESTDVNWLKSKEKDYLKKISDESVRRSQEGQGEDVETQKLELLPKITLIEFYRKYAHTIKSRATVAIYFVYFLQKIRKKEKIQTADVTKCFKEVGYPNWNKINMTDTLTSGKRRALVNYVNKLWSLTTTGEDYIFNAITGKKK